jgi:hypothetical protein
MCIVEGGEAGLFGIFHRFLVMVTPISSICLEEFVGFYMQWTPRRCWIASLNWLQMILLLHRLPPCWHLLGSSQVERDMVAFGMACVGMVHTTATHSNAVCFLLCGDG